MKLFEILDDFLKGKKIRRTNMSSDEWLEYERYGHYIKMKSTRFKFTPDEYYIELKDLTANNWEIIE